MSPHPTAVHAVRLPAWQRRFVYLSLGLLCASGLVWLGVHAWALGLSDAPASPEMQELPSPAKLWAIRVHAASAIASLLAIGSMLPLHVRLGWLQERNRGSGALQLLVLTLLTLTGYALGYASEGLWRQGSAWLHWALGAGMPVLLVAHIVLGRRSAAQLRQRAHHSSHRTASA